MRSAEPALLRPVMPWLVRSDADSDVALGSRVTLGRNLADYPFFDNGQSTQSYWEAIALCQEAVEAEVGSTLDLLQIDSLSLPAKQTEFLRDRSLVDRAVPSALAVDPAEQTAFLFGGAEHLCITTIEPSTGIAAAYDRALHWDLRLERRLNFAVALDWGYLSSNLSEAGTALRASTLLHLPALIELDKLGELETLEHALNVTLSSVNKESSALLRVENRFTIGASEKAIVEAVVEGARTAIDAERKARKVLVRDRRTEIAERAHRAYGVLQFSRALSNEDAQRLTSDLRLGVVCGLTTAVDVGMANSLFFMARDGHIYVYRDELEEDGKGEATVNAERARVLQELLRDQSR